MTKHHIQSFIITSVIFLVVFWFFYHQDQTKHRNIYYRTAVVTDIGQCEENTCSFTYKTEDGSIKYGASSKPVSVGQIVYNECWTEKARGHRCYVDYEPQ
ncbi:hypothetical protein A4_474 [Escherichia phage A4]|nr:hypothetical protein A4_474 [Escherichia phage A4]